MQDYHRIVRPQCRHEIRLRSGEKTPVHRIPIGLRTPADHQRDPGRLIRLLPDLLAQKPRR